MLSRWHRRRDDDGVVIESELTSLRLSQPDVVVNPKLVLGPDALYSCRANNQLHPRLERTTLSRMLWWSVSHFDFGRTAVYWTAAITVSPSSSRDVCNWFPLLRWPAVAFDGQLTAGFFSPNQHLTVTCRYLSELELSAWRQS